MAYHLGIDLGGSSVKCSVLTPQGGNVSRHHLPFDPNRSFEWADKVRTWVNEIRSRNQEPEASIGVSAPGLASENSLSISHMPGRLAGLEGLNWTDFLASPRTVPVLNDAHAALLGEEWVGAAKNSKNVMLLTLGTGVGGAATVDGNLLRGHLGRAGHLGHVSLNPDAAPDICGTPGSLEMLIGNCTIRERSRGRFETTHNLVDAYRAGDAEAASVWLASVKALAAAVCSFINVLDPEIVVIGGGIARSGEALFEPLAKFLDQMEWRPGGRQVKLVAAQLGEFAGSIGAAWYGKEFGGRFSK